MSGYDQKEVSREMKPLEIFKQLMIGYTKSEPPSYREATTVSLGIYINSFYSINEATMDYSLSIYLRQKWLDRRLNYTKYSSLLQEFKASQAGLNLLWIPDTYIRNEKEASFHKVTVDNRFLKIFNSGNVWYVVKITAVIACPMNLHYFPLDTQICPIMFESFGHTKDLLEFNWLPTPIDMEKNLQLPQYTIQGHQLKDCSVNYSFGSLPCIQINFILKREIGYYLIQVYIPSILIVILSWVSFWINVEASPARVSIGLLTVLTTTTMSAGARSSLPKVSYIKALDVWMIACLIFVFAGLIEYAVVNVLSRSKKKTSLKQNKNLCKKTTGPFKKDCVGNVCLCDRCKDDSHGIGYDNRSFQLNSKPFPSQNSQRVPHNLHPLLDRQIPKLKSNQKVAFNQVIFINEFSKQNLQSPSSFPLPNTQEDNSKDKKRIFKLQRKFVRVICPLSSKEFATDGLRKANKVDKISRRIFPITFLIFNFFYWLIYTNDLDYTSDL